MTGSSETKKTNKQTNKRVTSPGPHAPLVVLYHAHCPSFCSHRSRDSVGSPKLRANIAYMFFFDQSFQSVAALACVHLSFNHIQSVQSYHDSFRCIVRLFCSLAREIPWQDCCPYRVCSLLLPCWACHCVACGVLCVGNGGGGEPRECGLEISRMLDLLFSSCQQCLYKTKRMCEYLLVFRKLFPNHFFMPRSRFGDSGLRVLDSGVPGTLGCERRQYA